MTDPGIFTPYSTVAPLFSTVQDISWLPEEEQERIQAYNTYDEIYWNFEEVFKLVMHGDNEKPIFLPTARTVVDETAHYLLKELTIAPEKEDKSVTEALNAWLIREKFYSKFHTAKHSGVCRGDWIMHMTADENKPEGSRISIHSVDPSAYFPIYDELDPDKLLGIRLVEQLQKTDGSGGFYVRMLQYHYEEPISAGGTRLVIREELDLEIEGWYKGKADRKVIKRWIKPEALPLEITRIPVYHFKNMDWQGDPFGSSELRGHERLITAINQGISDEDMALALEGLGVWATDAPRPTDDEGNELDWEIYPGVVLEVPNGNSFNRVRGITSIDPIQDHLKFMQDSVFEGSGTFRSSKVDVAIAESGIALAIRFMPTQAKLEQRDNTGLDLLHHLFFEWRIWHGVYEGNLLGDIPIIPSIGPKLPVNRVEVINELNNMLDRKTITRQYYREELARRLGYRFPDNMAQAVLDEEKLFQELKIELNPAAQDGNESNNADRPNESAGTEAGSES